jgi:hypothetical protein
MNRRKRAGHAGLAHRGVARKMPPMRGFASVALVLVFAGSMPAAGASTDVTIYRCTDAGGRLTFRDTPCGKDQAQQTRTMLRPKDAPPVPVRPPAPAAEDRSMPPTRTLVLHTPRPLYECLPPGGEPYTSDTADGNPRWVPLWTLDYPMMTAGRRGRGGRGADVSLAITDGNVRIDQGGTTLTRPRPVPRWAYGAGTWIRDDCHALPQPEVCARLRDRRDDIRHRFFNAMPNERDTLTVEERGINARLDDDCGGH